MAGEPTEVPVEETVESHHDLFEEMFAKEDDSIPDPVDELLEKEAPEPASEPEPEPEPVIEGKPVEDPEPPKKESPPVTEDPYSWIDQLPEEHRDSARALKHEALSDRGRVSALSRKMNEMQTSLDAIASRAPAVPEVTTPAPAAQEPPDSLRQLKEDYPELGAQLDEIFAHERAQAEALVDSRLQPLQEKLDHDAQASEQEVLESKAAKIFNTEETGVHWKDVVQSEDFSAWLDQQPSFIQDTARTTKNASDGLDILQMYENAYQAAINATQETEQSTKQPEEDVDPSPGDDIKKRRAQRKASTVSTPSEPITTDPDRISGDYGKMFDQMWGHKTTSRR
jgi:hypothetical protein